jgi:predicted O-methyltransferase YrrM
LEEKKMPNIHRNIWNKFGIHASNAMPLNGAPWSMKSTREVLIQLFGDLGFKTGAEVGVERGIFSKYMIDTIPGLKLYCIDPWAPYAKQGQAREDRFYSQTMSRLNGTNAQVIRKTSLEGSKDIKDGSLDFVYIDALHEFDPVMMDIILWVPKVRSGGIVSGHDFAHFHNMGVIQAVRAYTEAHSIVPWYITTGEITPSWFWVKQ